MTREEMEAELKRLKKQYDAEIDRRIAMLDAFGDRRRGDRRSLDRGCVVNEKRLHSKIENLKRKLNGCELGDGRVICNKCGGMFDFVSLSKKEKAGKKAFLSDCEQHQGVKNMGRTSNYSFSDDSGYSLNIDGERFLKQKEAICQ